MTRISEKLFTDPKIKLQAMINSRSAKLLHEYWLAECDLKPEIVDGKEYYQSYNNWLMMITNNGRYDQIKNEAIKQIINELKQKDRF